eukprot:scaffold2441_cov363-Pavlova_lutheri.AAC.2
MFDGSLHLIDSLRRYVRPATTRQMKRNQLSRVARARGGTGVHAEEEVLALHLLEQHEKMESERDALKEGQQARSSKLDAEGRVHLSCQMEMKGMKRRSEDSDATWVDEHVQRGLCG